MGEYEDAINALHTTAQKLTTKKQTLEKTVSRKQACQSDYDNNVRTREHAIETLKSRYTTKMSAVYRAQEDVDSLPSFSLFKPSKIKDAKKELAMAITRAEEAKGAWVKEERTKPVPIEPAASETNTREEDKEIARLASELNNIVRQISAISYSLNTHQGERSSVIKILEELSLMIEADSIKTQIQETVNRKFSLQL